MWSLLLLLPALVTPAKPVTVLNIIQRSVQANDADWASAPQYDHIETDYGNGGTKTYAVVMLDGSPYQRLIELNGEPLSPAQAAAELQKLDLAIAARRNESAEQRADRILKFEKDRNRDHLFMLQMTSAFNFQLVGQQRLGARDVYVLRATPRPGYQPPNFQARALTGMEGMLWIDKATFQWVKVEAQVIRPVTIAGFLAQVEPGTRFELEKAPVSAGIWLPKHFAMQVRAKILFFVNHISREDQSFFSYRPASKVDPKSFSDQQ
ncbi:MAG TPA: hypothetical protein VJN93_13485 [Candidatus Acidoferrum sp.]|nr:hypothetical protein [Candidatus Acidoferrum sp.]